MEHTNREFDIFPYMYTVAYTVRNNVAFFSCGISAAMQDACAGRSLTKREKNVATFISGGT